MRALSRSAFLPFLALSGAVSAQSEELPASSPPSSTGPQGPAVAAALSWGDFDADGLDDALAIHADGRVALLRSTGDGSLEDVTSAAGLDQIIGARFALWGDYDQDGQLDLFFGTAHGSSHLMQNEGGAFTNVTAESGITALGAHLSAHWIDYDGDGALDLHLVSEGDNALYHALPGGTFERVELPRSPVALANPLLFASPMLPERARPFETAAASDRARRNTGSGNGGGGGTLGASGPGVSVSPRGPATDAPPLVTCASAIDDMGGGSCLNASSVATLGMLYPLSERLFVDEATGYVGIGTTAPVVELQVEGHAWFANTGAGGLPPEAGPGMRLFSSSTRGNIFCYDYATDANMDLVLQEFGGNVGIGTASPNERLDVDGNAVIGGTLDVSSDAMIGATLDVSSDATIGGTLDVSGDAFVSGNVGIGTTAPVVELQVEGNAWFASTGAGGLPPEAGPGMRLFSSSTRGNIFCYDYAADANMNLVLQEFGGNVGIGTPTPTEKLDVNGNAIVDVLTIRGGADLVEGFETSDGENVEPGTVVVIDPANAGALMRSNEPYDFKVAGVVSGAGGVDAGLHLGQDGVLDGDTKVAMTGRVYVKASAENGAIRPGDRLTTASLAGHAMKATDGARSDGAVIGKAMSSLGEGTGLVLVLVNLQ